MKIIEQSVEDWGWCPDSVEDTLLHIEKAARTCYRSEDKICEGSAKKMVKRLFDHDHNAMLEHSQLTVRCDHDEIQRRGSILLESNFLDYDVIYDDTTYDDVICVTGNYRAWCDEYGVLGSDFDNFLNLPEIVANEAHGEIVSNASLSPEYRRRTYMFTTSRDVTHELVRHRPCSFAQESQRYCASREDVYFIKPCWASDHPEEYKEWLYSMDAIEAVYHHLLKTLPPQHARVVLPNSTATQIVVTASGKEWNWIEKLRTAPDAYLPIRKLISTIKEWGRK